jgi:hypothetical protein
MENYERDNWGRDNVAGIIGQVLPEMEGIF